VNQGRGRGAGPAKQPGIPDGDADGRLEHLAGGSAVTPRVDPPATEHTPEERQ